MDEVQMTNRLHLKMIQSNVCMTHLFFLDSRRDMNGFGTIIYFEQMELPEKAARLFQTSYEVIQAAATNDAKVVEI